MFDLAPPVSAGPALQQHPGFARALSACGLDTLELPGPTPLLAMLRRFRLGMRIAMISRFSCDANALDDIPQAIRSAGLGRTPLILSPLTPLPELSRIGAVALMTPAVLAELDLTAPMSERRARLHQKWRNRLVRAEASALKVRRSNLPLSPKLPLFVADSAQQRLNGYRSWPVALTLAYARANPGQAVLFSAHEGGALVAEMLILRHGAGATYHIGYTTPQGRVLGAHGMLLWRAAEWLAAQGHTVLDLGLLDTRQAPGLARFKLGSGAMPRRLGGTWGWWPPLGRSLTPLARLDRGLMALDTTRPA